MLVTSVIRAKTSICVVICPAKSCGFDELKFITPELSPLHKFKLFIEEIFGTGLTHTVSPEETMPLQEAPESLMNNCGE